MSYVRPTRSEAAARLRTNGLALAVALIVTNLLPLPSPYTAFRVTWASASYTGGAQVGALWHGLCIAGALIQRSLSQTIPY